MKSCSEKKKQIHRQKESKTNVGKEYTKINIKLEIF